MKFTSVSWGGRVGGCVDVPEDDDEDNINWLVAEAAAPLHWNDDAISIGEADSERDWFLLISLAEIVNKITFVLDVTRKLWSIMS